jgi:hypothetical protein
MIRIFGGAIVTGVAGYAVGAEPKIHTCCRILMTLLALNRSVSAPKRKPVFMRIRLLLDEQPSSNTVAAFTITSQQTSMNIRMALGALCSNV